MPWSTAWLSGGPNSVVNTGPGYPHHDPRRAEKGSGGEEIKCPACGFTQADFKKAGRLGCSECYKTFAEGLEGLLKTMHKGVRHVGKVPQALRQERDLTSQLKQLQKRLDKAVNEEDFEEAASLRDEIKTTRDKLSQVATP